MNARLSHEEWVHQAAEGRVAPYTLDWVDTRLGNDRLPYQHLPEQDAAFRHMGAHALLPEPLLQEAEAARQEGEPTLAEALLLVFAWVDWSIQNRGMLWSPQSWSAELLEQLSLACGIGWELHEGKPERLSRLAARLNIWFPWRGNLDRSLELWQQVRQERPAAQYSASAIDPELEPELMACRSDGWWADRASTQPPVLRIEDGFLRFQPNEGGFSLLPSDVLVAMKDTQSLEGSLLRLLSAGLCLRMVWLPKDTE